jgi:Tol biopolymer transport system component
VTLVDRSATGAPLADGVEEATISPDGRHLVYTSSSADAPGSPIGNPDGHVYVVDLATGRTVLADRAANATPGNDRAFHVDISGDGSRVAFESRAINLGPVLRPSLRRTFATWSRTRPRGSPFPRTPTRHTLIRSNCH